MMAEERARLNRRAAELAGWTLETDTAGRAWWVPPLWGAGSWLREAPNFAGEPGLWWGLVERMAGLVEENGPLLWWVGPAHGSEGWEVQFFIKGQPERQRFSASTAGVCAVRAALAVAEALGLGPPDD